MTHWLRAKAFMQVCTSTSWAELQRRVGPLVARLRPALDWCRTEAVEAWQRYRAWVKAREVMTFDRQFLPAVMELQETPASPTARVFLKGLCAAVVVALLWSILGTIDITAVAQGRIVPTGRVKVIQPLDAGVVTAIHVEDGSKVKAGDVLVELDLTQTEADAARLTEEKVGLEADVDRLQALLSGEPLPQFVGVSVAVAATQARLFQETADKYASEIGMLAEEVRQRRSEVSEARQATGRLGTALKLLDARAARVKRLVDEGFYARNRFDLDETERLRVVRDLESTREKIIQAEAALKGSEERLEATQAEYRRVLLTELAERQEKLSAVTQELAKAEQRNRLQTLVAPIDGTVQELAVHTVGGVVTPAQELMKVVPFEDALEAEVKVLNKDVGFVEVGQPVAVKLEAFPFTKYGTVPGEVKTLSLDSVPDEQLGPIYLARVALKASTIRVKDKDLVLGSGLTLSAEITTGRRRIIEYFLSPLMEYVDESVRER